MDNPTFPSEPVSIMNDTLMYVRNVTDQRKLELLLIARALPDVRTTRPVRKSSEFSKSGLFGNWTFSFPDAGPLILLKIEKKIIKKSKQ